MSARDEIGYGLGLTRAGRTLDDERLAAEHTIDRHVLTGVGVEYEKLARGRIGVGLVGRWIAYTRGKGLTRLPITRDSCDDVVFSKQLPVLFQIDDQRHRRVGEYGCDAA